MLPITYKNSVLILRQLYFTTTLHKQTHNIVDCRVFLSFLSFRVSLSNCPKHFFHSEFHCREDVKEKKLFWFEYLE